MKKILQLLVIIIALGIFIPSCTMQKRIYMPGYSVMWKNSGSSVNKINLASNLNVSSPSALNETLSASTENSLQELSNSRPFQELFMINPLKDSCDTIVMKTGNEMMVNVWQILKDSVVYVKCGDKSEVPSLISRNEVNLIKYADGSKVSMEDMKRTEDSLAVIQALQDSIKLAVTKILKDSCDTIVMKDGTLMLAVVKEVTEGAIEYEKCEKKGSSYLISRAKVSRIKYTNGTSELIEEKVILVENKDAKPVDPEIKISLGNMAGIISSALGFLLVVLTGSPIPGVPLWIGMLLGIAGVVFGADALGKIDKYPELWKGKNLASVSVILGSLGFILFWIFLAKYMTF